MKIFYLACVFILFSCGKEKTIEVEVLTKQINAFNLKQSEYGPQYIKGDALAVEKSRTLLTYKITNHTNEVYYFNVEGYQKNNMAQEGIRVNNAALVIYDKNRKPIVPRIGHPTLNYSEDWLYSQYLNYSYEFAYKENNFVIHPDETLYFEWFVVLPFGNLLENANYSIVLNDKEKYVAKILMGSTANPKYISRTDLQTIKENHYKIYDGVITSKNTTPVVINNP